MILLLDRCDVITCLSRDDERIYRFWMLNSPDPVETAVRLVDNDEIAGELEADIDWHSVSEYVPMLEATLTTWIWREL